MRRQIDIAITPGACVGMALLLLILPLRWVLAAVLAATVHECWHYLALRLCGGTVYRIRVGLGKTVMETEPLQGVKELVCAAAGPLGSFSLLLFARFLPATAICALVQGAFNMIPVIPMDGGRIMRYMLDLLFPYSGVRAANIVEWCILTLIFGGCLYVGFRLQVWFLLFAILPVVVGKLHYEKNTLQRIEREGTIEIH